MTVNNTHRGSAFLRLSQMLEAALEPRDNESVTSIDGRGRPGEVSALARKLGIPVTTAHRQMAELISAGWLQPVGRSRHVPGPRLRRLARLIDVQQILVNAAVDPLDRLAARTRSIAQLGSLEEQMVTYRLKTGHGAAQLFTRVGMQLEAYCSGIGKVLLAHLPEVQRAAYLAEGPFPRLTQHTIVDPLALGIELDKVRERGFAIDDGEIDEDLRCFAAPLHDSDGNVVAAISLSTSVANRTVRSLDDEEIIALVRAAASEIEAAAFNPLNE